MFRNLLFLLLLAGTCCQLTAQTLWSDVNEQNLALTGERRIVPRQYRTVRLDLSAIQPLLAAAPERFKPNAADNQTLLTLPSPDGGWQTFRLYESPVMAPALQASYPDIRCYTGIGLEDPTARLKCDLTPWGFHAMVTSAQHNTVYIDPYSHGDRDNYVVYFKQDYPAPKQADFTCLTEDAAIDLHDNNVGGPDFQGDCMFRTYRLALACTGEYATFHGSTKPLVLAAMNTTMNRVNGVYEADLSITMNIVANNDLLIFLNAATDPYTNNDGGTMLGQNITTCNSVIGLANYDIGHVFSTGGGGIAGLNVVCTANKARGVTGGGSPIGDPFDIDYVAHEMGHQFGGNHTQNNSCNNVGSASMEPGSASTIMGYAGICNPNVQNNSDDYFHAINLQEMGNFVTGGAHTCPIETNTGNNAPTVNGGANYTIPKSTPFALTAVGNDVNNDPLTYCWEQMDPESAVMPPASTSATGPLFRSYKATPSPTRWFPRLPDLVANVNSTWEELPGVARILKFRVTVRDFHLGAGCTEEDDVVLTVSGTAGPFVVNAPNTNELWYVGETKTVTWSVASTNLAPINCANVRLLLSTDGGLTYPTVLLNSTANDGSADVQVPANISNNCRVMVQAVGNVFFDISNVNFRIQTPPVPTFTLVASTDSLEACAGTTSTFSLNVTSLAGFNAPVQLSLTGAPAGALVSIFPNPVTPTGLANVSLSGLTPAMAGNYTLTITGSGDTITQTVIVALTLFPGAPTQAALLSLPADGAVEVTLSPLLEWEAVPFATDYSFQLATNPGFAPVSLVFVGTTSGTAAQAPVLSANTVYYWRVQASNACGVSSYSATSAFLTANQDCSLSFSSTNVPVVIDPASVNTATSTINVPASATISDVNVNVQVSHSWVGDIDASVTSADGTEINLFDRPGVPDTDFGCASDNVNVTFDDEAVKTAADLEITCDPNPAASGSFQPLTPLADLDGENAQGLWTLAVTDNYAEDGGSITGWSVTFCIDGDNLAATLTLNAPLTVLDEGSETITNTYLTAALSGAAIQGNYTVLTLPQSGQLLLNGVALTVGGTFTQADINAGLLTYQHDGSAPTSDNFHFDFTDQNNGAWLHDAVFNFVIIQNTLVSTVTQTQDLDCHDDATGQITVTATGGTAPLTYSLNGSPQQANNVFSNLAAGVYVVVVTDANAFTSIDTLTIVNPAAISITANVIDNDVTVTASGGTGTLSYSLNGGPLQAGNVFENLANGTYTLLVSDVNGCTATATASVAVNTLVVSLAVQNTLDCAGDNDGSLVAAVTGGTPPLSYSLNGGPAQGSNVFGNLSAGSYTVVVTDDFDFTATTNTVVIANPPAIVVSNMTNGDDVTVTASGGTGTLEYSLDGLNFQAANIFADLANGVYTVTIRDDNGCTATSTAIVAVNVLLAALDQQTAISCAGGNNGALAVTVGGGTGPYTYSLNGGPTQTSPVFTGLAAGTYTATVQDALNVTATTNTVVLANPAALTATTGVVLSTLTVTAAGGTAPLEYSLDGLDFQSGNVFTGLANGAYTVTIRDANGCLTTATATVNVTPLTFGATVLPNLCAGDQDATLTITVNGGAPPFEYSLNGSAFQSGNVFTGLAAGAYLVSIQDINGCTTTTMFNVNVGALTFTAATIVTSPACFGGNDGTLTVGVGGGIPPYEYSLNDGPWQSSNVFTGLSAGPLNIKVRDAAGTIIEDDLTISETPALGIVVAVVGNDAMLTVSGGAPPFSWMIPGETDLIDLPNGIYTLTVTDANGCTGTTTFTIDYTALSGSFSVVGDPCASNDIQVTGTGGVPPYQYSVNNGPFQTNPLFSNLAPGSYTFRVRDAAGDTYLIPITIIISTQLSLTASTTNDTVVAQATGGGGPFMYSLGNGPFQTSPLFVNVPEGIYTLTVMDVNGCTATTEVTVMLIDAVEPLSAWGLLVTPNPSPGLFQLSLQDAPTGTLRTDLFDATGRLLQTRTFAINGGSFTTTFDLLGLPQGIYLLRLSDGVHTGTVRLSVIR